MRARWEQLSDTSCLVASLCQTESGTKTRTAGTDDDCIVFMIDYWVVGSSKSLEWQRELFYSNSGHSTHIVLCVLRLDWVGGHNSRNNGRSRESTSRKRR